LQPQGQGLIDVLGGIGTSEQRQCSAGVNLETDDDALALDKEIKQISAKECLLDHASIGLRMLLFFHWYLHYFSLVFALFSLGAVRFFQSMC
jgi:hypothetical protein